MAELDRRRFLAGLALGGVGTVAAGSLAGLASTDAAARGDADPVDGPDPGFLEGKVLDVARPWLVVAVDALVLRRVVVTAATRIWKARFTTIEDVRAGDRLYARGTPGENGDFLAETIWVNIVNLHAEIVAVGRRRLELAHPGGRLVGHLLADTVASYDAGPETRDLSRLRPGAHVQVIGAWRLETDEIELARIYAPLAAR